MNTNTAVPDGDTTHYERIKPQGRTTPNRKDGKEYKWAISNLF
jgi:hypothetical protein